MSMTDSWAYRSAERAHENANPYDDDCTCDEKAENMPQQTCPAHGWCNGCDNRNCGDCQ